MHRSFRGTNKKRGKAALADEPHPFSSDHAISAKRTKRITYSTTPMKAFPRLRSGRTVVHPLVVAAATIEVASLGAFQLDPDILAPVDQVGVTSSQSIVTEVSRPVSPGASPPASPPTSQLSTETPCSPRRPTRREALMCQVDEAKIPTWYAEVYDSDGYDTDALELLVTVPSVRRLSHTNSDASSPGFEVVGDTALQSARDEWLPEPWPANVELWTANSNDRNWKFPVVTIGVNGGAGCGCKSRCNARTCQNAKNSRFCNEQNCVFAGVCGNGLHESTALAICRNTRTGMRGLVATEPIPAGEVIGQYFGHIELFGPPCRNGRPNEGYRMHLKTRTTSNKRVGIDALEAGGKLRMMNHSCKPAARFHEVRTGRDLAVVAVTVRDVFPGEEVTVSYGSQLWFLCRCGWWGCQHRDIHHLQATRGA